MIVLTKLDKSKALVTLETIKYIESTPDTLIRFTNGDLLIVCESLQDIEKLAIDFKTRCLQTAHRSSSQKGD